MKRCGRLQNVFCSPFQQPLEALNPSSISYVYVIRLEASDRVIRPATRNRAFYSILRIFDHSAFSLTRPVDRVTRWIRRLAGTKKESRDWVSS